LHDQNKKTKATQSVLKYQSESTCK